MRGNEVLNIFLLHQLMTAAAAYNDLNDGCFMTQQEAGCEGGCLGAWVWYKEDSSKLLEPGAL